MKTNVELCSNSVDFQEENSKFPKITEEDKVETEVLRVDTFKDLLAKCFCYPDGTQPQGLPAFEVLENGNLLI